MAASTVIILCVCGFIGLGILMAAISAKKRRDQLEAMAREHGWYFERNDQQVVDALSEFPLVKKGRARHASNVLLCGEGADTTWVFDYRFTIGAGQQNRVVRQTVVAFPYLDVNLPAFELQPEHLLTRLAETFGRQDIDFPQFGTFSSSYSLRGPDEAAIRQLFNEQVVDALCRDKPLFVEAGGSCLMIYRQRHIVSTNRLLDAMSDARGVRDRFVEQSRRLGWAEQLSAEPAGV